MKYNKKNTYIYIYIIYILYIYIYIYIPLYQVEVLPGPPRQISSVSGEIVNISFNFTSYHFCLKSVKITSHIFVCHWVTVYMLVLFHNICQRIYKVELLRLITLKCMSHGSMCTVWNRAMGGHHREKNKTLLKHYCWWPQKFAKTSSRFQSITEKMKYFISEEKETLSCMWSMGKCNEICQLCCIRAWLH